MLVHVSRRKYSLRRRNKNVRPNTGIGTGLGLLQIMNNKREGYYLYCCTVHIVDSLNIK